MPADSKSIAEASVEEAPITILFNANVQAATFYRQSAEHLCDYQTVVKLVEQLADRSEEFAAELRQFAEMPMALAASAPVSGFDFASVAGGGSEQIVLEAERGTTELLQMLDKAIAVPVDDIAERLLRKQKLSLTQTQMQLERLKARLYRGQAVS